MKKHQKEKVLKAPTLSNLSRTWFLLGFWALGRTNNGREEKVKSRKESLLCGFGFSFV